MTRVFVQSLVAAFVLCAPVRAESPQAKLPTTFDVPAVDAYIAQHVKDKNFVGLSVAVMREGQVILQKGYGVASLNGQAVTPDTPFAIGSVTKQFTCACIFLLAEGGKLSVHDKVAKYYPNLTRAGDVTLYDLMSHASGYPDYYPLDFLDRRMRKPIAADDLIREYAGSKLDFDPAARWSYSNTGYIILGRIVEKTSEMPFGTFLERRVFKPLAMNHSVYEPKPEAPGLARGYTSFALGPAEPADGEALGWAGAAGALYASAPDLCKWDLALMNNRVVNSESFRLMTVRRELANGKTADYGCGLSVNRQGGETVVSHSGAVSGFHAYNAMVPRTNSAVVVLSNAEHVDAAALHRELLALLLRDQAKREVTVPVINGLPTKEAAVEMFKQMQAGTVDRERLGEEFSLWMTDERLKSAAPRLKDLGEPTAVEVENVTERGGMEASRIKITFKSGTVKVNMFRSTDGKVQQFLLSKG